MRNNDVCCKSNYTIERILNRQCRLINRKSKIVNGLLIFKRQACRVVRRFFSYLDIVRVGLAYRGGTDADKPAGFFQLFDIFMPLYSLNCLPL